MKTIERLHISVCLKKQTYIVVDFLVPLFVEKDFLRQ